MGHDHQGGGQGCGCGTTETKAEGGGCCSGKPAHECCKTADGPLTREQMEAMDEVRLVQRYRRGIEVIDRRVLHLDERRLDQAFLPDAGVGRWPVRVLLGHVADAELVFVHRMRRAVGEDNPVVAMWDENAFIDANVYGATHDGYAEDPAQDHARVMHSVGGHLAVIHTLRQWHSAWLLSMPDSGWTRRIMHPERGAMTVKTILSYATWHLEHHAKFLMLKLDKLVGDVPEPEAAGGCGSGCGCGSGH